MQIFSNPIFVRVMIAIGIAVLWVATCWIAYIYGHRHGYTDCLNKMRANRRSRHKPTRDGDIRVQNPVKSCAKAESVRVVATHAPRLEKEDA